MESRIERLTRGFNAADDAENSAMLDDVLRQTIISKMSGAAGNLSIDNFDPANIDDQFAKLAMETTDHKVLFDHAKIGPFVVNAVYLCLRQAEVTDRESGEVRKANRTMIVDDKGDVWGTNSEVAERVTKAILGGILGKQRFEPPLPIRVAAPANGSGGFYLNLSIARADIERVRDARKRREAGVQSPQGVLRDAQRPDDPSAGGSAHDPVSGRGDTSGGA